MESLTLDELDRQLVHALSVHGRASFATIGDALGRSDRTLAHRYRRLRAAGMRVVGVIDAQRTGQVDWLVRIRCAPDAAAAVAAALARRPDTSWVAIAAGGTEITCITRTSSGRDHLLLEKLARTPRIHTVTAQCLLRGVAGTSGWPGRTSALDAKAIEQLAAPRRESGAEPVRLTETDTALLRVLAVDGRAGYPELAAATGSSESTARRRLAELHRDGVLRFDVDIDPALLGYGAQAALWLTVAPGALSEVASALARHPEIGYAAATTGATNIVGYVVCRDLDALYEYLADRLGGLHGVLQLETSPTTRQVKRAGALLPVPGRE